MRVCPECKQTTTAAACPRDGTPTIDETLLREAVDPLLGTELAGRFRLLEPLGRGGMGRVYVADQITMKRRVAVKVIRADTFSDAADRLDLVRRFQREALAASRLQHPNTVRVFDYGSSDDGLLFIAMELLVGPTLAKVLRQQKRLPADRAVRIAVQACKSLSEAHQQGIVHRDMKPENIVLTEVAGEPDFVKVLDFGIAKMAVPGSGQSAVTRQGLVMGTPAYMAPEQARAQTVGPAADLYSLGVVLYHCLSGRVPFDGDTPLAVMMKHGVDPVPPLVVDGFPPDVPPALERLVLALLSKRPEDRPGPALDVARLLEASLWDRTVRFGTPDAVEQATAALPAAPSAMPSSASPVPAPHWPTGASDEARGPRRWPWLVMAGVVLIAVLAWLAWPSTPVPPAGTKAEAAAAPDTAVAVPVAVPAPAPNPGPPAAADVRTQPDPAPVPAPAEDAGPPAAVTRRLPACKALKCPFTAACIGPDGRRTKGEDWCMPVFK